jgi:hypothetical protein
VRRLHSKKTVPGIRPTAQIPLSHDKLHQI